MAFEAMQVKPCQRVGSSVAAMSKHDDLDWALRTEQEVANGFLAQRDAARAEVAAWERIWRLLGEPGVVGESKSEATWVAVRNLLDWIACGGPVEAKRAKHEADRERDAALAEVEKWRLNALVAQRERDANSAEIDRMVGELSVIRMEHEAEVAALMGNWRAFRETLLERDAARAEVAALRDALNVAIRLLSDVGITCTVESLIGEAQRG